MRVSSKSIFNGFSLFTSSQLLYACIYYMKEQGAIKEQKPATQNDTISETALEMNIAHPVKYFEDNLHPSRAESSTYFFSPSNSTIFMGSNWNNEKSRHFVLRHELAHIKQQHPIKKFYLKLNILSSSLMLFMLNKNMIASLCLSTIYPLTGYYSQYCERQADLEAAKYSGKEEIESAIDFFENQSDTPQLVSTEEYSLLNAYFPPSHPSHKTRVEYLRSYLDTEAEITSRYEKNTPDPPKSH